MLNDNKISIPLVKAILQSYIYGYMYGKKEIDNRIIKIDKRKLEATKDETGFLYVWGWPGPDYNFYSFKDYGKTWSFNLEDLDGEYVGD
jgi:hypothetical protein